MSGRRRHFGSVRERPSGRWEASYWHDGVRQLASETFTDKKSAQSWLSGIETDIRRGGWIDPQAGQILFSDFARGWLASRPDLRPRSVIVYQSLLDQHLIPAFGPLPISDVAPSQVRTWYARLVSEKPGAARSAYRLLRAVFNTAVHDEILLRSPCRVVNGGTDRTVERPMLTVAEVQALTDAMPQKLRAAVSLAAWGGLRRGEVLALRRKDVNPMCSALRIERAQIELSDGTVQFNGPKTDAGVRTVHLPEAAMELINCHLGDAVPDDPDALLFTGQGGGPMRAHILTTAFTKARTGCGIPRIRFHDLRHFSLTMAAAAGASTRELMSRGGHSTPAAALRYQHATEDRDRAIADALSALAGGTVSDLKETRTARSSRP